MHEKVHKRLFIIDGYSYLFRAYHSMPPLTDPEGTPVGGVYGFTNMLTKLQNRIHAANAEEVFMLIAFDSGRKTFRNDIYPEYKANRPEPPEDLKPQFPLIREAAEALNIETLQTDGFEADDIIATYAKKAESEGFNVTIVSSDKDLMQLITDRTKMYDPMRDKVIGTEEVKEKFGVYPEKVLDLLSLTGDSIDNIPGVPGIGPKTAAELLNQFGNLDDVLKNAETIKQNKRRETLLANKENALLSRELASLSFDVPFEKNFEDLRIKTPNVEKLFNFLKKHGFNSLIKNLEKNNSEKIEELKINSQNKDEKSKIEKVSTYEIINNENDLKNITKNNKRIKNIAIYFHHNQNELELISITINEVYTAIIKPILQEVTENKEANQSDLFATENSAPKNNKKIQNNFDYFYHFINEHTCNDSIEWIFYDLKDELKKKRINNIENYLDIHLAHYCLNGSSKNLELANYLNEQLNSELLDKKNLINLNDEDIYLEIANYSYLMSKIAKKIKNDIFNKKINHIFYNIDNKLIPVLAKMEARGIIIDKNILNNLSVEFEDKISELENKIHKLAGKEFNIGSPKQLGEIIFDDLGIDGGKKTKTGQYKTDSEKLEELAANGFEIADKVLEWRSLSKLTSTYTKALVKEINPETGRVHTNFNITATTTGRLSSNNPNLQNIPIRTENGRKIRKSFIAGDGKLFIGADYSQIELRLLAHMADIDVLKNAFKHGEDIHKATACQVFGLKPEEVDAEKRRAAKTINFGIIYGQSAFGLAKQLKIDRTTAKEYIEEYFRQYPGIRQYMSKTIDYAKQHEYVKTLLGRKIYLPSINDKNGMTRSFAERAAINAPLQGTAADIIKIAMIKIDEELQKHGFSAELLLQIHDELIIECDENIAEKIAQTVKATMENVIKLDIPLIVDTNIGNNWGDIH